MTRHELASFALKLLGIYVILESLPFLLRAIAGLAAWPSELGNSSMRLWTLMGALVPFLLAGAVGVLLFVWSRELAPRLVGEDKPLGLSSTLTGRDVQAIGFSIVAVLIFLRAIPQLAGAVWIWSSYAASQSRVGSWSSPMIREVWQYGLSAGIHLVLAVVLFLQARGLANLWHRIRIGKYVRVEETQPGNILDPRKQS